MKCVRESIADLSSIDIKGGLTIPPQTEQYAINACITCKKAVVLEIAW